MKKIWVLQGGWCLVGIEGEVDKENVKVKKAHVIRIWGTDRGIGQLIAGPRKETTLDPIEEEVIVKQCAIIFQFKVMDNKWKILDK